MLTALSPIRSRSVVIFSPGGDEAQVAGGRLMQREEPDALLVGLDVEPVDLGVALR